MNLCHASELSVSVPPSRSAVSRTRTDPWPLAVSYMLAPYGVVRDDEATGVRGMGHGRQDLNRHVGHGRRGGEVAHLPGHHLGGAYLPVEGQFVNKEDGLRRIVAGEHATLPFDSRGEAGGYGFFGDGRERREDGAL